MVDAADRAAREYVGGAVASAWISPIGGRLPSSSPSPRCRTPDSAAGQEEPDGSAALDSVVVQRNSRPRRHAEPVLDARTIRSAVLRSPSKCSTTSTDAPASADRRSRRPGDVADGIIATPSTSPRRSARWSAPAPVTRRPRRPVSPAIMVCRVDDHRTGLNGVRWPRTVCTSVSARGRPRRGRTRSARRASGSVLPTPRRTCTARPAPVLRPPVGHLEQQVDLPTPGPHASRVTDPGTTPPRTRSVR